MMPISSIIGPLIAAMLFVLHAISPIPLYVPCQNEDGSGVGQQFPCYWDAHKMGNGRGDSYVLLDPPIS